MGLAIDLAVYAAASAMLFLLLRGAGLLQQRLPRGLFAAAVATLLLALASAAISIHASHDPDVELRPVPGHRPHPGLVALLDACGGLGFVRLDDPLQASDPARTLLYGLCHRELAVYATVFDADVGHGGTTSCDFVSVLAGGAGVLITAREPWQGALPPYPGELRQIFAGADAASLFARHLAAMDYLTRRGVACEALSPAGWEAELRWVESRRRQEFLAAPLRKSALVMWRALWQRTPHRGALADQPSAERLLRGLAGGRG